jgi:hypothetical protein
MSAVELKSVRETYSRVAVMDTAITGGITNIYIGSEKLVSLELTPSREERTMWTKAVIRGKVNHS